MYIYRIWTDLGSYLGSPMDVNTKGLLGLPCFRPRVSGRLLETFSQPTPSRRVSHTIVQAMTQH